MNNSESDSPLIALVISADTMLAASRLVVGGVAAQ